MLHQRIRPARAERLVFVEYSGGPHAQEYSGQREYSACRELVSGNGFSASAAQQRKQEYSDCGEGETVACQERGDNKSPRWFAGRSALQ
jgi:hypothetical protein